MKKQSAIKKRVHFVDNYLLNPQHPVTVNVIGAGGTGSQVVTSLARIDASLRALNHPGLYVTVYDPDTVSEANIGRQLFSEADLEQNKAIALVTRINRFFGTDWKAETGCYPINATKPEEAPTANFTITCTDNVRSRLGVWRLLKKCRDINRTDYQTPLYWMDFGNSQKAGQVVVGNVRKKIKQPSSEIYTPVSTMEVITEYTNYSKVKEEDSGPSCSLAEALDKQDLFVNSILAQLGCDIIWQMFREGIMPYRGLYLNLATLRVNPIPV